MPAQWAIERQLMEGDDRQTFRSWRFEAADTFVTMRRCEGGDHLFLIRLGDVEQFCADLKAVAEKAKE